MEFQKRVIDSWRNHGPSAADELREAIRLYEQIKIKALAFLSPGDQAIALPEPQEQEVNSDPAKVAQQYVIRNFASCTTFFPLFWCHYAVEEILNVNVAQEVVFCTI